MDEEKNSDGMSARERVVARRWIWLRTKNVLEVNERRVGKERMQGQGMRGLTAAGEALRWLRGVQRYKSLSEFMCSLRKLGRERCMTIRA